MTTTMENDTVLRTIVEKARAARDHGYGPLSTGERLAAALVLNDHEMLARMDYTITQALARIGMAWSARLSLAARIVAADYPDAA
ncbi:hypothetical protein [Cupriavidus taiwanensis]|uniref:hypothetical protein n=1 Tax=Cupriavidus taiwanensis TaxID=164546 RepID=UPI000E17B06E|nr:hypothetical protein [Cupriavidus taiwanensis]SPA17211.1 conserved hypothetical protein [Cupriavidus taiwanensis]